MSINQTKQILIVDDEPTCRRVLELGFAKNTAYNISLAANSKDAINIIKNSKLDLIITDLHLGDEDSGFEICKTIKESDNLNHIPIISVSALKKKDAKPKKYSNIADSDFHFNKPFDIIELTSLAKNLLQPK